jgi:hypothetical protein
MAFASQQQINAIAVENRKFHHKTIVQWMNYTVADILFNYLKDIADRKKEEIMMDLKESAKKVYIPSVSIFSVYECVFAKISGSRDDCRHESVRAWSREPMSVLDYVTEAPGWHDTPDRLIPEKFYKFGHMAPDDQNDFYQSLRNSDTLRLLENYLGDNFSCHVDRKEIRKTLQFTAYKVEVSIQFHLTKRPVFRKEQIAAAVQRYADRQKAIEEDRRMDRWHQLYEEDTNLAAELEAIPYPYVGLNAFKVSGITARRKIIYAKMYPEDGPEYDQDDLNKAAVANRHGF